MYKPPLAFIGIKSQEGLKRLVPRLSSRIFRIYEKSKRVLTQNASSNLKLSTVFKWTTLLHFIGGFFFLLCSAKMNSSLKKDFGR